jgi:hypothetical protein
MKKKFRSRNESGFYLISFAVVVIVFGSIGTAIISTRSVRLQNSKAVMKAYYDAEVAIDLFGQQLRQAYDMAAPIAESSPTTSPFSVGLNSSGLVTDNLVKLTYVQQTTDPSTGVISSTTLNVPLKFYLPGGGNKLCVHRSDGTDMISATGLICIILPGDFASRLQWHYDENLIPSFNLNSVQKKFAQAESEQVHTREFIYQPPPASRDSRALHTSSKLEALLSLVHKSFAQTGEFSANPGLVAAAPFVQTVAVTNYNPDTTNNTFQIRYGNNNCLATQTDRFCFTIKFCLKVFGTCSANDPVVHQTYVFMKAPQSTLFD